MIIEPTVPSLEREKEQRQANLIIERLQSQIAQLRSNAPGRASFDEALKSQLQENKLLKIRLDERAEEIERLKDQLSMQQKSNEALKIQMTLLQMKMSTELRGKEKKLDIQLTDKSNELQTARRALETLDLKYRAAIQQVREKDKFIMNYLVGRSKQSDKEEIRTILQQYQIAFPENRVMEDLLKEQRQIQALRAQVKRLTEQA